MNNRRSSLRKPPVENQEEDVTRSIKRRISFSGKKFIREFNASEKPNDYNNSYEISDHLNVDDSSGQTTAAASLVQSKSQPLVFDDDETCKANSLQFQLHSSINVTLLPNENIENIPLDTDASLRVRKAGRDSLGIVRPAQNSSILLPASRGVDSLSLSDAERDKLNECSIYKQPTCEKTFDLMPSNLSFAGLEPDEDMDTKNKVSTRHKTVLFENFDMSCDFSLNMPKQKTPVRAHRSPLKESQEFLPDDSTNSPLIPMDVMVESGISKRLNFLQLNEALNSGSIQVFPNGPRTPIHDRRRKLFSQSTEQKPVEHDVPIRDKIKPRCTLNFNESMLQSPATQPKPTEANNKVQRKLNYRYSQADEQMLNDTNFLSHAKLGDETRSNSKCSSKRESVYETTNMELDELMRCEAALNTLEPQHSQTVHKVVNIELEFTTADATHKQKLHLDEYIVETAPNSRQTMHMAEPMHEEKPASKLDRRQTLHLSEDMFEDSLLPCVQPPAEPKVKNSRQTMHQHEAIVEDGLTATDQQHKRQTMHVNEPMKVELKIAKPSLLATANRRGTLLLNESISMDMSMTSTTKEQLTTKATQGHAKRQTMHLHENIASELPTQQDFKLPAAHQTTAKLHKKSRQTLLLTEPIEEDTTKSEPQSSRQTSIFSNISFDDCLKSTPNEEEEMQPAVSAKQVKRQTLLLNEPMLAEYKTIAPVEQQMQPKNCRQTLLLAEPIEEECNTNINLNHVEPRKSRQTLLLTEPIEEDIAKSEAQSSQQKHTSLFSNISFEDCFRSTPNEEEELQPQVSIKQLKRQTFAENKTIAPPEQQMQPKSARQTLLLAEPIEEERTTDLNLKEKQLIDEPKKSRQTLLLTEPIEEDITKSEPQSSQQKETAIFSNISFEDCFRSTPNEEEEVSIKQVKRHTLVENKTIAPPEQQMQPKYSRQTLLLTEPIEEERNTNLNLHHDEPRKSRQTLLLAEPIEEDFNLLQIKQEMIKKPCTEPIEEERNTNLNLKHNEPRKSRQTLLLAEPMEEDLNLLQNEPEIMEKPQRSRQTLLSTEAIEEEPNANLSFEHYEQMKVTDEPRVSRQTMLLTEPIEEDLQTMVDNLQKTRQTLHEYNAIEMDFSVLQDVNMPLEDKKKKSRVTLLHNEPIHEEVISTQQDSMAKFEASQQTQRATMFGKTINVDSSHLSSESMPSGVSSSMETQEIQTKEPELTAKQISARKTQHQVEPMEEDSYDLPEYKITRKTYFANAPIELDDSPKPEANNKSVKKQLPTTNKLRESLLRQTCIEIDDSDTQSRTPVRKPISNFFPITPGMSMTEFEGYEAAFDESHSKALPMETSSCDTPVSRPRQSVNIKRLPTHLTPNLPEAKKRSSKQPLPSQLQLADDNTLQFELKPGTASTELDGTVQMIRAAAVPRKSLFEDGPITISDVADHFAAQANNNSGTSRSSTDCTAHDKFVNLGGDTVIFSAENTLALDSPEEDIDKTRFSLVSSMEEEQEHTTAEASSHSFVMEAESCLELQSMPNEPGAVAVVCKKCTNCRRTIEANETIKMVNYKFDFGLDEIRRLEQRRRNLQNHVENYWEMKYLEIQNTNVQHETTADLNSTAGVGNKTLSKQQKLQMFLDMLQPQPFVPVLSFAKRLDAAIEQQAPNWIFDHQRACDRVYFFSHTKLSTFRLLVKYEPLSYEEIDIKVRSIEALTCSLVPQERWSVYEHFEDFELRLKLPLNLCQLLDSSDVEGFIKLLQHIDNAAAQVKLLSKQLFSTLFSMHASLIREPNRNIVRKTISKFVMGEEMEIMSNVLTDYKIEIGNLAETSFKNIIQPPLHQLDEKIQFLPKGIEFLKEFLKTPEDFIKPGEIVPSYLAD